MFRNYLQTTLRTFKKDIVYTLVNVLGLSVGIACFVLIALYVKDEVGYDKFHKNSDRIYRGILNYKSAGFITSTPNALLYAVKEDLPEVENAARISFGSKAVVRYQDEAIFEPESYYVDASLFEIFDFPLAIGDEKTALMAANSLVISPYIMEKYFDGENPIGQTFKFENDTVAYNITGVLKKIPNNSRFQFNFLRPLNAIQAKRYKEDSWTSNSGFIYVLVNTEIDTDAFASKVMDISTNRGYKLYEEAEFLFEPYEDLYLKSDYSFTASGVSGDAKFIYIFSIVGLLLLLIACTNYINLSTAKSFSRAKEIGVRKVVGANRKQIKAQFFGETLVITLAAVILAGGLVEYFRPVLNDLSGKSIELDYFSNPFLIGGLLVLVPLVTLLAGAYPAVFMSHFNPLKIIKGKSTTNGKDLLRKSLVVFQFVITLILTSSALIIRSQVTLFTDSQPGFNEENVITTSPNVFVRDNTDLVKSRLLSIPGVSHVTGSTIAWGGSSYPVRSETFEEEDHTRRVSAMRVEDNFVETFDVEVIMGRGFMPGSEEDFEASVMINETAMEKFGWTDPLGMPLEIVTDKGVFGKKKVIGVFKDLKINLKHEEQPLILQLSKQHSMIQVRIDPATKTETIRRIRAEWEAIGTGAPFEYQFVDEMLENYYRKEKNTGSIFNYFTAIAILIAALGLLGLSAYTTAQKSKEIGIRKVLGARVSAILRLLVSGHMRLVFVALFIAIPITYYFMSEWLGEFANRVPVSWKFFAISAGVGILILVVAVSYQTLKATFTNPVSVLRDE